VGSDEDALRRYKRLYQTSNTQLERLKRENDALKAKLKKREPEPDQETEGIPVVTRDDITPGYRDSTLKKVAPGQYDPIPSERPDKNAHQQNLVGGAHWVKPGEGSRLYADEQPAKPRIPRRLV